MSLISTRRLIFQLNIPRLPWLYVFHRTLVLHPGSELVAIQHQYGSQVVINPIKRRQIRNATIRSRRWTGPYISLNYEFMAARYVIICEQTSNSFQDDCSNYRSHRTSNQKNNHSNLNLLVKKVPNTEGKKGKLKCEYCRDIKRSVLLRYS